ncbi:MAG TPA: LemA family protein [Clostridia bacterium]|nr:LemA family protein [Clostridia bacterium]
MEKNRLAIIAVVAIIAVIVVSLMSSYNRFVSMNEDINGLWAQVENQLQRRYDLIPNLVETVKGYASHEERVFTEIAEARAKLAGATTPQDQVAAANQLEGALSRLLVIVERYPDLKANQNFIALQDELTGTENRLAVARMRFNDAVKAYNAAIKRFPAVLYARMFGFGPREYFEIGEEAKEAPKVDFGT